MNVKTRIFEERYSGGVLDLNIFCFAFMANDNENGSLVGGSSSVHSRVISQGGNNNARHQEAFLKDSNSLTRGIKGQDA